MFLFKMVEQNCLTTLIPSEYELVLYIFISKVPLKQNKVVCV